MPRYTRQQLDEQYKKLPDSLKDAIFSVDVSNKIFGLGKQFSLTIEEIGFIAEEAGYVILGLTSPKEFPEKIKGRLDIEDNKISGIVHEVNKGVFLPIREALKRAHQFDVDEINPLSSTIIPLPISTEEGAPATAPKSMPKTEPPAKPTEQSRPVFIKPEPPKTMELKPITPSEIEQAVQRSVPAVVEKKPETVPAPPPKPAEEKLLEKPAAKIDFSEEKFPFLKPRPKSSEPKIPPIDLRRPAPPKPEMMRGTIFAAPSVAPGEGRAAPTPAFKQGEAASPPARAPKQVYKPEAKPAPEPKKPPEPTPWEPQTAPKSFPRSGFDPYRETVD